MGNRQSVPQDDIIKRIRAKAMWRQPGSEPMERGVACDPKRSLRRGNDGKHISEVTKRRRNVSRIMWRLRPLWQESELKTQRQQLNKSRTI